MNEIIDNINSIDKIERLNLQKEFLEMEYDRISRSKMDEIKAQNRPNDLENVIKENLN